MLAIWRRPISSPLVGKHDIALRRSRITIALVLAALLFSLGPATATSELRGTGDLGIVVERAAGSIVIVDTTRRIALGRVEGLGDLSHASAVFSRDQRFAYVFGRDGGLTKVDLLAGSVAKRHPGGQCDRRRHL